MQYDTFYFLHMPKCDGRRFMDLILLPLDKANQNLKNYNIEERKKNYYIVRQDSNGVKKLIKQEESLFHQGWDSRINDSTYIVSILRDPIERAASWYAWKINSAFSRMPGYNKGISINLNKEKFIECVERDTRFHNPYAKMILNDISSNILLISNNSILQKDNILDLILERCKRINLLIKMQNFQVVDKTMLANKITNDMGLTSICPDIKSFEHSESYTLDFSKNLYNSLTDEDKSHLKKYLALDYEIYNNENLFWKNN